MTLTFLVLVSLFIICSNANEKLDKEKCKICGYNGEDLDYRIVNGDSVDPKKYPWVVSIAKDDHDIFCTGALISSQYILTAAHCVEDGEKKAKGDCDDDICFRKAESLEIGTFSKKSADEPSKTMKVSEVIPHPDFDGQTEDDVLYHDIALLKLEEKLSECNVKHGPICLMQKNDTGKDDDQLHVAGWGFSTTKGEEKNSEDRVLRKGTLKQLPSEKCTESHKESEVSDTIICGVSSSDKEQIPCEGDSGSSVFKKVDGAYYSLGVGSTIMRDQDEKPCTLEGKVKYTKVSSHFKWIEEHVKDLPKSKKDD